MSEANLIVGGGGGVPIRSIAWFPHGTPHDITINGARYLRSGFVETDPAKFDAQIWGDTPGLLWRLITPPGTSAGSTRRCMDIESNGPGDILVALFDVGAVGAEHPRVMRSPDGGLSWNLYQLSTLNMEGNCFYQVAYGAAKFVLVGGSGKIATSVDGITYTPRNSTVGAALFCVKFNGSMFVAAGQGVIVTSTDGLNWVSRAVPTGIAGQIITGVEFGNNTWIVCTQSGDIATAPADGSVWTIQSSGIVSGAVFFDAETSKFYLTGGGRAASSSDGIAWFVITTVGGPVHVSANATKMLKLGGYFFWVESSYIGGLVRSKDLKALSEVFIANPKFPAVYPTNLNWVKRLQNGKLMLNQFESGGLVLYQGNLSPFAGAVIATAHTIDYQYNRPEPLLVGYSRIS